jgi:hypothetical protein
MVVIKMQRALLRRFKPPIQPGNEPQDIFENTVKVIGGSAAWARTALSYGRSPGE